MYIYDYRASFMRKEKKYSTKLLKSHSRKKKSFDCTYILKYYNNSDFYVDNSVIYRVHNLMKIDLNLQKEFYIFFIKKIICNQLLMCVYYYNN